jgi:hypothetical protein
MRTLLILAITCLSCVAGRSDVVPLRKLDEAERKQRIAADLKAVAIYRAGLKSVVDFARQQTNLFRSMRSADTGLPRRHEKEVLWQTWQSYLDYLLALDSLAQVHRDFFLLSGEARHQSFLVGYAAFLAKYRFSLEFINAVEANPVLHTILNEPVPEIGLPSGTYAKVKYRFLNVGMATEFAARSTLYLDQRKPAAADEPLREAIAADREFILKMGLGKGEFLTVKNALKIVGRAGESVWLPVQTGVAEWMGDTKVYRKNRSLISPSQIEALHRKLVPGDVLLIRRDWYLSNVGLPGFWPHAALYIGTPVERRSFFGDPAVKAWVKSQGIESGDMEELLQKKSSYAEGLKSDDKGHPPRVLEAISEGVSFTTIEHCADGDSLVALRPSLSKTDKAIAIARAFHYAGRPYDFSFDFATDSELVCTELVFKAYEPSREQRGLRLPLIEMLGRALLPANEIVRQFDAQYGTADAQFEFVTFLDAVEKKRAAVESPVEAFRQSWRRPKWHVLLQDTGK